MTSAEPRRLPAALVAAVVLVASTVLAPLAGVPATARAAAAPAGREPASAANTEVSAVAETVYRLDPAAGVARVEVTFEVANLGDRVLDTFVTWLPATEGFPSATTPDGVPLALSAAGGAESHPSVEYRIELPAPLSPGGSTTVVVRLEMRSGPPRTDGDVVVNDAVVALRPIVFGDPGSSLVVVLPDGYVAERTTDLEVGQDASGAPALIARDVADPPSFSSVVVADRPHGLRTQLYTSPSGSLFEIRYWPGDDEWAAMVREELETSIPELELVTGLPWPNRGVTVITEEAKAALAGYDGRYLFDVDEVRLSAEFPRDVFVHELSHAWFDRTMFADRWVREGFAELATELTRGDPASIAASRPAPRPDDPAARPLLSWRPEAATSPEERARVLWAYDTSVWVLNEIAGEIGLDRLRAILAEASRQIPGPGWRQLLDMFEDVGGSTRAGALFETFVVDDRAAGELAARTFTRARFDHLVARVGRSQVPEDVLDHLAAWRFGDANEAMDALEAAILSPAESVAERVDHLADAGTAAVRTSSGVVLVAASASVVTFAALCGGWSLVRRRRRA